jgi:hypothetical protein
MKLKGSFKDASAVDQSSYELAGFENRNEYIDSLKDEYGSDIVDALLTIYPASEDFDGLISALEDHADDFEM